jgi:ABC-type transport system substrate-binding protein
MAADDPGFAEAPLGTGPFRLQSRTKPDSSGGREAVFIDNPLYGRWRDRAGQPYIKEVRMREVGPGNIPAVAEAFQQGSLHILTDVPTADVEKLRGALAGKAQEYVAANNRRAHILALNLRRPPLQSKLLRQGLMMAVQREAILSDVFRAGRADVHRAMTGPFPPAGWATTKGPGGQTVPLANPDLALQRIRTYLFDQSAKAELTLIYPDDRRLKAGDEPKGRERCEAEEACQRIKAQVEGLFKPEDKRKLTILLEPVPTRELLLRVEDEHRYDLAYAPFDYPDDWYPLALGAALDPQAAERGGRNWFGFLAKGTGADADDTRLVQLLGELRAYRAFGALATRTAEVQKLFNECVPFVPLWQLDRHVVVSNGLKVYTDDDTPVSPRALNPTTLFHGVARWKLE